MRAVSARLGFRRSEEMGGDGIWEAPSAEKAVYYAMAMGMEETKMRKWTRECLALLVTAGLLGACGNAADTSKQEPVTILAAAAASLKYSFDEELIPMFQDRYPWITVEGTYDSSGKLRTQIEEGMEADVFMSAAMKQMQDLEAGGYVDEADEVKLLENKIVLIVPEGADSGLVSFEDIVKADTIALGDPESVPVGQYAQEALTNLNLWDEVTPKTSFGTNVTEVLNWVAEGSADAGIVYATDAATTHQVRVVAEAPADSLEEPVIYPVAVVKNSAHREAAELFVEFLQSEEAMKVFEDYGFSPAE